MLKKKTYIIYYVVLSLVMFFIMRPEQNFPNFFRIAFLFLVVSPTIFYPSLLPAALTLFLTVSITSFSQLLPTTEWYYVVLVIIFAFIYSRQKGYYGDVKNASLIYLYFFMISILYMDITKGVLMCIVPILLSGFIKTKRDVDMLFCAFLLVSLILSLQYVLNFEYFAVGYRSDEGLERATWSNPNIYGLTIGCGGILSGAYLMSHLKIERSSVILFISSLTLIVVTYTLILNASRGALLFYSLALLIMLLFSNVKSFYKVIIVFIGICGIYYLYTIGTFNLLLYRMLDDTAGTGGGRTTIWINKLNAFTQESNILQLLFGIGVTGCTNIAYTYSTHNDLITSFIAFGFFGMLLFLVVLFLPYFVGRKKNPVLAVAFFLYIFLESSVAEPFFRGNFLFIMFYFFVLKYFSIYNK